MKVFQEGVKTLEEAREILRKHKIEKLPIVDEEFRLKGLITIKRHREGGGLSQLRP